MEKIIGAKIQVDTGNSSAEVKELNKGLSELKTNLAETGTQTTSTSKEVQASTGNFAKLKDQMGALPGPLGAAGEGVNKLGTAFKALLANPVVLILTAIVAVLALLYKAFTNSFEGGQKVEQVFAGIKAVGQSLIDSLDKIGSAIVKVFSFDFSGAIDDIKEVGEAAADSFNKMSALTKRAQELKRESILDDVEAAERAKKLAILREQASDDSVPIAERKKALLELQEIQKAGAVEDVKRAKEISENTIAQLTIQKDGAEKNLEEISKAKIEAINVETENANEARRIAKQVTAVEKQEQAERTEAAKAGEEKRKEAQAKAIELKKQKQQDYAAYTNKLTDLQQSNEIAQIKDGYARQLRELEIKYANERAANIKNFEAGKVTKLQLEKLNEALDVQIGIQRATATEAHNKEIEAKEIAFQKDITSIKQKTMLDGITDTRKLEQVQLDISYQEKLQQAITRYADDSVKLAEAKTAIDEQQKQAQAKLDEKNAKEDATKKLTDVIKTSTDIINDPESDFDAKREALQAEVDANEAAYAAKTITENEYTANKIKNTETAKALDKAELDSKLNFAGKIADALGGLSALVGKQTAAGKALAVAQASISAIQGAISSYTSLSGIPIVGPVLGGIAAAAAVAAGVANIKKIVAVPVPGAGGGGAAPSISLPSAPIAPTQQGTKIDQSSIAGIGDATSGRTYVLSQDITSDAERNTRLNRASRLGG